MGKFLSYRNYSSVGGEDVPVTPDVNFAIKQGDIYNYILAASTATAVAVPTGAKFAVFNSNADLWVKIGSAATVPTADILDGSGSELNPEIRYIGASTTIGLLSESAAKVSIMYYQ